MKIHELSLIYSILLKLLFGISRPQQYESLFALGLRYMGLNLTFWPLLVIFEKHCQKINFLIFSNPLAFLVEQIVTDNVDIEK